MVEYICQDGLPTSRMPTTPLESILFLRVNYQLPRLIVMLALEEGRKVL
jgi:hypothetical protein